MPILTGTSAADTINGGVDDDQINGLGGNDFIHGNGGADTLDGGDGDDVLRGGYSNDSNPPVGQADGADILNGGAGNDVLRGQNGNDQLFGGSDDDNLRGDLGDDLLDGGDGFDMAAYRFDDIGAVAGVTFDASLIGTAASIAFADGRGGTDTLISIEGVIVVGTTFRDIFTGSSGRDQITTVAGNDVVDAGGGNDVIIDYNGSSTLNGGDGDDRYDMVAGGYYGGAGSGSDTLDGGAGDDTVVFYWAGVSSNITINLTAGNLTASTANAALAVTGTSIEQLAVFGGSGNDSLTGGDADDVLIGGAGADVLNGGDGDDELEGGAGDDTLNGGAGLDRYRLSVSNAFLAGVVDASGFNVSGGTTTVSDGQGGTDTISGIEGVSIVGGNFNDTLIGSAGGDTLNGGYGGDTINGGGGDDLIIQSTLGTNFPSQPGVGQVLVTETADAINGGDGFDTVSYVSVSSDMVVDLGLGTVVNASTGNDTLASIEGLITGSGADLVTGSDAANRLESGAGDDVVRGGLGDDVILGGDGTDRAVFSGARSSYTISNLQGVTTVVGPDGTDTLTGVEQLQFADGLFDIDGEPLILGTEGDDDLVGGDDAETIEGRAGSDFIRGGGGNDLIYGGDEPGNFGDGVDGGTGDDVIEGGTSNDTLAGGDGADTIFGGDGNDRISGSGSGLTVFSGFAFINGVSQPVRSFNITDAGLDDGDSDSLFGGAGNDVITVSAGDSADGGDGTDSLVADFTSRNAGLTLDLTPGAQTVLGGQLGGTFTNFETFTVIGTVFADNLTGSAGNDTLDGEAGDDTLNGGDGADSLQGGLGADIIDGGAGNDGITAGRYGFSVLIGGVSGARLDDAAVDTVSGGDGDDTATVGFGDNFDGGAGADRVTVSLAGRTSGVTLDLTTDAVARLAAAANASYANVEFLSNSLGLTEFDDALTWTGITGGNATGSGNLYGYGGNDRIIAGAGSQFVGGNEGDDYLDTGIGNDRLWGGSGADTLLGGDGVDILYGDEDNDNALNGVLPSGNDTLNGGTGNDELWGGGGSDNLLGGDGNDLIRGDAHTYVVNSGRSDLAPFVIEGNDVVDGGLGDDTIYGDGGDDILTGGAGNDRLDGGAGIDTVSYAYRTSGFFLNLSIQGVAQSAGGELDTLIGIENAIGTGFNDTIRGNEGANLIQLGGGSDLAYGGLGADTLEGGDGNDSLWHGANINMLTGQQTDPVTGAVLGLAHDDGAVDSLSGGGGNDVLYVGLGDTAAGGDGFDRLFLSFFALGSALNLDLSSGDAATLLAAVSGGTYSGFEEYAVFGTLFDDTVRGTSGSDRIYDNFGFNTFYGGDGDDLLSGGFDGSNLYGEAGNDILYNGASVDGLYGGDGDDVLFYGSSLGPLLDPPVAANDILSGGAGLDRIDFSNVAPLNGQGVRVNLAITSPQNINFGRVMITGVENLTGSAFSDDFSGDGADNVLSDTRGGNDRFIGGAGNDTLSIERSGVGAANEISLIGGLGDDALTFNGNGRYTDTVLFEGQDGNDVILAVGAFKANVNGGAGNDRITVDTLGGSFAVKLGSGTDTLVLAGTAGGFAGSTANVVRDFIAGNSGDVIDLTAWLAGGALTNYTPGDNPFLDGHMRLVQAGADTLVQVDRDGGSNGFVTVLTLQKTFASSFTAFNFNGLSPLPAPVEGGAGADSLTGTEGIDVLNGNGGDDRLTGGAGGDTLNGGAGHDVLDGGDGDDFLNGGSGGLGDTATYATASAGVNVNLGVLGLQNTVGSGFDSLTGIEHLVGSAFTDELRGDGFNNRLTDTLGGNDFLRGEAGNDTLLITRSGGGAATTVRLNGGIGDDSLTFTGNGRFTDTVTLEGDAGNDLITVSGALTIGIDAGAGDDTIIYDTLGGVHRMTLGTGVDTVRLAGTGGLFQASGDNLVRDFTTGAGGDIVDLSAYIAGGALTNYTGGSNPFADGHMRLVQNGTRTLLQVDRDGGGNGYQTVLAFANTTVANFTTANFNGFDPTGAVPAPVEGSDKDTGPQVLPTAGDDFLVLPGVADLKLTEDGPQVLPGVFDDGVPLKAGLFDFDRTAPFELVIGEDGVVTNGWDHRDHGQDGWLF